MNEAKRAKDDNNRHQENIAVWATLFVLPPLIFTDSIPPMMCPRLAKKSNYMSELDADDRAGKALLLCL
jgi:hypothetical protein